MTSLIIIAVIHTLGAFIVGTIMWKRLTNVIAGWDIYASASKMKWDARWMFCLGIILSIFWEPTVIFIIFWNILYWIAKMKYDIASYYRYAACGGNLIFENNKHVCDKCGLIVFVAHRDNYEQTHPVYQHYSESDEWKKFTHTIWYQIFMDL